MTVNTSFERASNKRPEVWRAFCSVCKGYIDLTQGGNPAQLQELFIKNHKYCGQGWDKQYSLIKEKHHYLCMCTDCVGNFHGYKPMKLNTKGDRTN